MSDAAPSKLRAWGSSAAQTALWLVVALSIVAWLGSAAPPATIPDVPVLALNASTPVSLASVKGKPTLLYFWATWCGACKVARPVVENFARRNPEVRVLAITTEPRATVQRAFADEGPAYEIFLAGQGILSALNITAFPTFIAVNAAGAPTWRRSGVPIPGELDLRATP